MIRTLTRTVSRNSTTQRDVTVWIRIYGQDGQNFTTTKWPVLAPQA